MIANGATQTSPFKHGRAITADLNVLPEISARIAAEQVQLLYTNAPAGFAATFLNAGITAWILWGSITPAGLLAWLGLIVTITLARIVLAWRYHSQSAAAIGTQYSSWRTFFLLGAGAAGLAWGALGFLFLPELSLSHQILVLFVLGGMATGGLATLSSVLVAFLAFALPLLTPVTLWLFLQGTEFFLAIGLFMTCFAGVLLATARQLSVLTEKALQERFHNLDLVQRLALAKEQAENVSQQLMESNNDLERHVIERTASLSTTNQLLGQEIAERRRIEEALRERARLATLVADISVALAQGHSLNNTLQRCTKAVVHHLKAAFAQIWTFNQAENVLELQASAGKHPLDDSSKRTSTGQFEISLIAQDQRPYLTNTVLGNPRVPHQEWVQQEGLTAFAGYPLIVDDQVVGVLALFARQDLSDATRQALAAIANDIAVGIDRKRAEETLQQSEKHFRSLIEYTSDLILILNTDGAIHYQSPSLKRILGYESEEFQERNAFDFIHPDEAATVKQFFIRAVQTRKPCHPQQFRVLHKNGSWRVLEVISSPLFAEGTLTGFIINARDITERKQLEAQLAFAQKMESIGQLAAGIAHEINTPAQYVGDNTRFLQDAFGDLEKLLGSYAQLFDANKAGVVPPALLSEIEAIRAMADLEYLMAEIPQAIQQSLQGIGRVTTIVRAMKEFSHPGSEEKSETDLNRAIETTTTVARNEWKYVAELVTDFDPTLPLVRCLPGEINQVILNLIINAAHAIADVVGDDGKNKGAIMIRTRHQGDWVEIRVSDNGTGIPEANRLKIFEPFFTTKGVGKGTGQGLAIAHSVIVDKHNGTISCETEEGKGTTFVIRLPLLSSPPQAEALL